MLRSSTSRCSSISRTAVSASPRGNGVDHLGMFVVLARGIAGRLVQRHDQRAARHQLRSGSAPGSGCAPAAPRAGGSRSPARAHSGCGVAVHRCVFFLEVAAQLGDVGLLRIAHRHADQRGLQRAPRASKICARFLGRGHAPMMRRGWAAARTMWSCASRCSTLRTSGAAARRRARTAKPPGSLVPGASRWLVTPSNTER